MGRSLELETQLDGFRQILPFQFQGDEWVVSLDVFQWSTLGVLFNDIAALIDQLVVIQLKQRDSVPDAVLVVRLQPIAASDIERREINYEPARSDLERVLHAGVVIFAEVDLPVRKSEVAPFVGKGMKTRSRLKVIDAGCAGRYPHGRVCADLPVRRLQFRTATPPVVCSSSLDFTEAGCGIPVEETVTGRPHCRIKALGLWLKNNPYQG